MKCTPYIRVIDIHALKFLCLHYPLTMQNIDTMSIKKKTRKVKKKKQMIKQNKTRIIQLVLDLPYSYYVLFSLNHYKDLEIMTIFLFHPTRECLLNYIMHGNDFDHLYLHQIKLDIKDLNLTLNFKELLLQYGDCHYWGRVIKRLFNLRPKVNNIFAFFFFFYFNIHFKLFGYYSGWFNL